MPSAPFSDRFSITGLPPPLFTTAGSGIGTAEDAGTTNMPVRNGPILASMCSPSQQGACKSKLLRYGERELLDTLVAFSARAMSKFSA